MSDYLARAEEILDDIKAIAALQCTNCGFAYRNVYGTHDLPWWRIRPRCRYRPAGEVTDG